MEKWRSYLVGTQYTWLTDCPESSEVTRYMVPWWQHQLLWYDTTICARPERMLWEVDTWTRYNLWTSSWRSETESSPHYKIDNWEITTQTCIANVTQEFTGQWVSLPEKRLSKTDPPQEFTPAKMILPNYNWWIPLPYNETLANVEHFILGPTQSSLKSQFALWVNRKRYAQSSHGLLTSIYPYSLLELE